MDWILGDSRAIPPRHFDVAVLTGNVVQRILDPEWRRTLLDLGAHLRTGESVTETARFAFRQADTRGQQLAAASFEVDAVYQDWAHIIHPRRIFHGVHCPRPVKDLLAGGLSRNLSVSKPMGLRH